MRKKTIKRRLRQLEENVARLARRIGDLELRVGQKYVIKDVYPPIEAPHLAGIADQLQPGDTVYIGGRPL